MWKAGEEVKKTEVIAYIKGKTVPTATKYLKIALENGLIEERKNPADPRSILVGLTNDTKQRLDDFFDSAVVEVKRTAERIRDLKHQPDDV